MKEQTIEKIKGMIFRSPLQKVTVKEVTKRLLVNPKTAEKYLIEMELMKILKRETIRKTDKYGYKSWRINDKTRKTGENI